MSAIYLDSQLEKNKITYNCPAQGLITQAHQRLPGRYHARQRYSQRCDRKLVSLSSIDSVALRHGDSRADYRREAQRPAESG